jgi:peptide/nickel transport system permease protein
MNHEITKLLFGRFLSSLLTLFLLTSFMFIIIRLSPGNPTDKFISAQLGSELSERITEKFSLNEPITKQYYSFIVNAFQGDFGISYDYRMPVFEVVWQNFSFTLIFVSISFMLQIVISISLAIWANRKQNRNLDNILSSFSLLIYSIPVFVLGVALIYLVSVQLNVFPTSGIKSLDYDELSILSKIADRLQHLVLPLITLTASGVALFYKYIKESMDEIINQTFIINLKASGLINSIILIKHLLPNAIRPLISVAGVELGILLGGTLITEVIFSLPGMGRLTINSIFSRDYPLIIGCVFTAGLAVIITNFLADIIKLKIDKRLLKGILS